jgi:hypothetical protein
MLKVAYEKDQDQIFGMIEGELTMEVAKSYFIKVAELSKETNCAKILTDLSKAKLTAVETDMQSLSSELENLGISLKAKRAIVVSDDVKLYKTWENFCFRNGFQGIRLFMDEKTASEWLLKEETLSLS